MQLKVILNRQLPSKVKDDPSSVERFLDVVLDSHIVAAALAFFGMDSVDSQPTQNVDLANLKEEKWGYLSQVLQAFIDHRPLHTNLCSTANCQYKSNTIKPTRTTSVDKNKKGCFKSCTASPEQCRGGLHPELCM